MDIEGINEITTKKQARIEAIMNNLYKEIINNQAFIDTTYDTYQEDNNKFFNIFTGLIKDLNTKIPARPVVGQLRDLQHDLTREGMSDNNINDVMMHMFMLTFKSVITAKDREQSQVRH